MERGEKRDREEEIGWKGGMKDKESKDERSSRERKAEGIGRDWREVRSRGEARLISGKRGAEKEREHVKRLQLSTTTIKLIKSGNSTFKRSEN